MTSEGLGEMFEGDSVDTCAGKISEIPVPISMKYICNSWIVIGLNVIYVIRCSQLNQIHRHI